MANAPWHALKAEAPAAVCGGHPQPILLLDTKHGSPSRKCTGTKKLQAAVVSDWDVCMLVR